MKLLLLLIPFALLSLDKAFDEFPMDQKIVLAQKRIVLDDYPEAYNPSILQLSEGLLMCFRYTPDRYWSPWLSYIGLVWLDDNFEPLSKPQILSTRTNNSKTQSQSEDPRLFSYRGRVFLIYNDNMDVNCSSLGDKRDMFVAELFYQSGQFSLSSPLKLVHQEKAHLICQKNWAPFEWEKKLLISYTVNPHEILYANLQNGACYTCHETESLLEWDFGRLRESSPA